MLKDLNEQINVRDTRILNDSKNGFVEHWTDKNMSVSELLEMLVEVNKRLNTLKEIKENLTKLVHVQS